MDSLPNRTLYFSNGQARKMSREETNYGTHSASHFVCANCKSRFQLPPGRSLSIRFSGRIPEVECPDCADRREADETEPS